MTEYLLGDPGNIDTPVSCLVLTLGSIWLPCYCSTVVPSPRGPPGFKCILCLRVWCRVSAIRRKKKERYWHIKLPHPPWNTLEYTPPGLLGFSWFGFICLNFYRLRNMQQNHHMNWLSLGGASLSTFAQPLHYCKHRRDINSRVNIKQAPGIEVSTSQRLP